MCSTPKSHDTYNMQIYGCREYIIGVVDTWEFAVVWSEGALREEFCIAEGVLIGQLGAIVIKYLKANPEHWHYTANSEVLLALEEAFPCE
jgi:hypothetical protein